MDLRPLNDVRVFTYWEGQPSPLIELCLASLSKNTPMAEIWNLARWGEFYDGLFGKWKRIRRLSPVQQSDVIRVWLLKTYGGIWIDADCIVFRDIRGVWSYVEAGADMLCYRSGSHKILDALIACRPESNLLARQIPMINSVLDNDLSDWRGRGISTIRPVAKRRRNRRRVPLVFLPSELIHPCPRDGNPFGWLRTQGLREDVGEFQFHPDAYGFMLTHDSYDKLRTWGKPDLMKSGNVVGQALRRAFGD